MKHITLTILACLGAVAFAQQVHFDYDRSANFTTYKTYQWMDQKTLDPGDQLLDRDIKRAVNQQLVGKSLRQVDNGGDLQVTYQGMISQEKQFDGFGWGGRGWGMPGSGTVTTSTIEVGTLVIELFDSGTRQLVWRGVASKTLDISKDPDKNYKKLEKAMAELLKNYPPHGGKS
jgi:hypothetical protein